MNELPRWITRVLALKEKYAHVLYEQEGQAVLASETFQSFFAQNEAWLFPYACYCFLRDREGNADFTRWGTYQYYEESNLRRLVKEDPEAKKATDTVLHTVSPSPAVHDGERIRPRERGGA